MAVLYGVLRSRATRVVWLAHEAGIDLELRPVVQAYRLVDPYAPDAPLNTLSPAFLAVSPAGAVPVLQDGDLILSESLAITLYLARTHGGDLGPRNGVEDALMQQWAFYGATAIEGAAVKIMYVFRDGRQDSAEGQAELLDVWAQLQRPLQVIADRVAAEGFLVSGRFTVADINLAETLRYAAIDPVLANRFPALAEWLQAQQTRPAFQAMWAARLAEPE